MNMVTVIGSDSVQEVDVNGETAVLFNGFWEGDPESGEAGWNASRDHTLIFNAEEQHMS
jgi:hypothetical protein